MFLELCLFSFYNEMNICIVQLYRNAGGCIETKATIEIVQGCPQTQQAWTEAAIRKNCGGIPNSCSSFVYHCVMNTWQNETVEVCAQTRLIVGRKMHIYNEF